LIRIKISKILTLGILSLLQTPSLNSLSLISHAKIEGHSRLYSAILETTPAVATRGCKSYLMKNQVSANNKKHTFDPPIARGLIEPVS
jgi:hypothetical protein